MRTWRVRYEDLRAKIGRYPFWKMTAYVEAESRQAAIEKLASRFSPPNYGNYRASPSDKPADFFFA